MYYFKPWSNVVYSKAQYYVTAFFIFYLLDLQYIWFFINLVVRCPCFLNKNVCGNHCSDAQIFYIILIFCKPMPIFVAGPNIKFCHIHVISFIVFPHEKLERNHIHFSCKCKFQTKLDVCPIESRFNANQFCSWREEIEKHFVQLIIDLDCTNLKSLFMTYIYISKKSF